MARLKRRRMGRVIQVRDQRSGETAAKSHCYDDFVSQIGIVQAFTFGEFCLARLPRSEFFRRNRAKLALEQILVAKVFNFGGICFI